jgi:hypothetical protein
MTVANSGGLRARQPRFPPAESIVLEESLGALRACPKNMLKVAVLILPFLLPSGWRIGPRYHGAAKSRLTQKYSIRNIAKHENLTCDRN